MSAEEVFELSNAWAKEYDEKLAALYAKDEQYAKDILNIDREKLKVKRNGGNPFVASCYVCCPHQMVVNCMSKVICRNSVCFKKHNVNNIFRHFNFALNHIVKITFFFNIARRF